MAGNYTIQDRLRQGIEAARRGDKLNAQRLLRQVVDRDKDSEVAWMWLASTLDNLQERRAALEEALRINPGNTRAQEAIRQLDAVMPQQKRTGQAKRQTGTSARVRVGGSRRNVIRNVAAILVVLAVIVIILIATSPDLTTTVTAPTETPINQESVVLNTPLPSLTINPDTYTVTPFFGVIVTADNLVTLPPTFTPTFTPTASDTPLPTATPFPMSGFTLLYTSLDSGEAQPALYRMAGDGNGDSPLSPGSNGFNDIAYAPNGQLIAFVRTVTYNKDGNSVTAPELFIAPIDNLAGARQITSQGGSHLATPAWASDSNQLLFVSNADGDDEIWYITQDGNNLRQVTQSDGVDKDPSWSPNNDEFVFASERANYVEGGTNSGVTEIFSAAPDGSRPARLTDAEGSSYSPQFSPDGSRIVFASDRSGTGNIYIMDPDGQRLSRLTLDSDAEDRQPAFTPNGKSIIFLSNRDGGSFQFYVMDVSGSTVTRLSDPGRSVQSFAFLPIPLEFFGSP